MKKMIKKPAIVLAGILLVGTLGACSEFDAGGYVKAILDNAYLNDAGALVELEAVTAEEAASIYEEGIASKVETLLASTTISEELKAEYNAFYRDLYSSAKYTVGEAVKADDTTYEVTVTYERLNIYEDAIAAYEEELALLVAAWTEAALAGEEVPTDEQMNEQIFTVLKDCLREKLMAADYDAPETMTIRIESVEGVWTPNQADFTNLESVLFDTEALYGL